MGFWNLFDQEFMIAVPDCSWWSFWNLFQEGKWCFLSICVICFFRTL